MQYILLIYENEAEWNAISDPERQAEHREYVAFTDDIRRSGNHLSQVPPDPLAPTSTATTVRVRQGKTMLTDGPFAETKEQLGGYYVVDCKDLDEAIELASGIPAARHGSIEVRPIWEM